MRKQIFLQMIFFNVLRQGARIKKIKNENHEIMKSTDRSNTNGENKPHCKTTLGKQTQQVSSRTGIAS